MCRKFSASAKASTKRPTGRTRCGRRPGAFLAEDRDALALCHAERRALRSCAARRRRAGSAQNGSARRSRTRAASRADKQLALRFVVHLVGDLHQPLHVGKCCDKGGNDVKVKWFGRDLNLHSVWDSALVDEEQLSLHRVWPRSFSGTRAMRTSSPGGTSTRATGSARARRSARRSTRSRRATRRKLPELSYSYVYQFTPVMERRLSQAGVRLAAYLNAIYAEPQPLPAEPAR